MQLKKNMQYIVHSFACISYGISRVSDKYDELYQGTRFILKATLQSLIQHISNGLPTHEQADKMVIANSESLTANFKIEPRHEISTNVVCATSKTSEQPAHTHSLIRAFASCLSIL